MADIFYEYNGKAYANLTNKCNLSCDFCIRRNGASLGSADSLWLKEGDPTMEEILAEMDAFHLENYSELTFCGYGEPTYALDNMIATAKIAKERYGIPTRVNTNGLGNVIWGRNIIPELEGCIDTVSISLNAASAEKYNAICHPKQDDAYEQMQQFAADCRDHIPNVVMTVVDVLPEEDLETCRKITERIGVNYRIREYESE